MENYYDALSQEKLRFKTYAMLIVIWHIVFAGTVTYIITVIQLQSWETGLYRHAYACFWVGYFSGIFICIRENVIDINIICSNSSWITEIIYCSFNRQNVTCGDIAAVYRGVAVCSYRYYIITDILYSGKLK